jgi:hypothetical protein
VGLIAGLVHDEMYPGTKEAGRYVLARWMVVVPFVAFEITRCR